MSNQSLIPFSGSFELELPVLEDMDAYIDYVLPQIRPLSEDLEEYYFLNKRWLEIRDDEDFHESILHIFHEDGEYLRSLNGDVTSGTWRIVEDNALIIEHTVFNELFDLAFNNNNFFVLRKHGAKNEFEKKYFVMGRENYVKNVEWRDIIELMYNEYRQNFRFRFFLIFIIVIVVVLVLLSLY